jgi:hypothetical protein
MKTFFIIVLRLVSVLIALVAARMTYFAMWFRLEGSSELEWVEGVDIMLGAAFAVAFVLFFIPNRLSAPKDCFVVLCVAAVIWLSVSGFLISSHQMQDRIRSTR